MSKARRPSGTYDNNVSPQTRSAAELFATGEFESALESNGSRRASNANVDGAPSRNAGVRRSRRLSFLNYDYTLFDTCLHRHDWLGIFFYDDDFPGLNRPRRVVLLMLVIWVAIGLNLFAFSAIDGNCFKVDFCSTQCRSLHDYDEDGCGADSNISLLVTDLGDRESLYNNMFLFPPPNDVSNTKYDDGFDYCSSISNPFWDYSPICVRFCSPEMPKMFGASVLKYYVDFDASIEVNCTSAKNVQMRRDGVLLCETVLTRTRLINNNEEFRSCSSFSEGSGAGLSNVSWGATAAKIIVGSIILLIVEQLLQRLLLWSQPKRGEPLSTTMIAFKGLGCLFATLFMGVFVMVAVVALVLGALYIGEIPLLWILFALGLTLSLTVKWVILSPLKIYAFWLARRSCPILCMCCGGILDEDKKAEEMPWHKNRTLFMGDGTGAGAVIAGGAGAGAGAAAAGGGGGGSNSTNASRKPSSAAHGGSGGAMRAPRCERCRENDAVCKIRLDTGDPVRLCSPCVEKVKQKARARIEAEKARIAKAVNAPPSAPPSDNDAAIYMPCENCHKKEAFTEVKNESGKLLRLCPGCARDLDQKMKRRSMYEPQAALPETIDADITEMLGLAEISEGDEEMVAYEADTTAGGGDGGDVNDAPSVPPLPLFEAPSAPSDDPLSPGKVPIAIDYIDDEDD